MAAMNDMTLPVQAKVKSERTCENLDLTGVPGNFVGTKKDNNANTDKFVGVRMAQVNAALKATAVDKSP